MDGILFIEEDPLRELQPSHPAERSDESFSQCADACDRAVGERACHQPGTRILEPEFMVSQDGREKQDCEIQAGKRWLEKNGEYYAKRGVTILGDDLYSHQPYRQVVKDKHLHFCKPDSHANLYETVDFLAAQGVLASKVVRKWNGRYGEIHTYRYANRLALYAEQPALVVNW